MDLTLPLNISAHHLVVDSLYYLILVITGLAFVLVEAGILWFIFRYRGREGRSAVYTHGNTRMEVIWTVGTAVLMVFLGIYSGRIWAGLKGEASFPDDAVTLDVRAKQFEWNITYPGADGALGSEDDFTVRNHLHVPAEEPVVVRLESEDVIHSFFLPVLRVKQDVVPGMTTRTWFEATETGSYELACAELCGLGHYRMRARVTIHEREEFHEWQRERSRQALARR